MPPRVVIDNQSAGCPVSGSPLFCGRKVFIALSFIAVCALPLAAANAGHAADFSCATHPQGEQGAAVPFEKVSVESATDGDTVVLNDGRRVRIIGINAAELSKKSERALKKEALQARDVISALINEADHLKLVNGDDAEDRYGRVLAHLLLPDGRSLASELLARGLAAATAVSPNTRCAEHHYRIERSARGQKRGLWQYANNPWFGEAAGTNSIQGFHILSTHIESITQKRSTWHIELANGVKVFAKKKLVSESEAEQWIGRAVEVRGWFGRRDGRTSVKLHHRQNLLLLP